MTNRHFEQIMKDAGQTLRPLLQRAFEAGVKAEHARIVSLLETGVLEDSRSSASTTPAVRPRAKRGGKPGLRDGSMNHIVFTTIKAMVRPKDGVDALVVHMRCTTEGHDLSISQVRTALKQLQRAGYLIRLELGKYALKDEAPISNETGAPSHNGVEGGTSSSSGGEERRLFEAPPGASPAEPGR